MNGGNRSTSNTRTATIARTGTAAGGKEGATIHITEECERLFCETLRAVFFGEKDQSESSLVMGSYNSVDTVLSTTSMISTEVQMRQQQRHAVGGQIGVGLGTLMFAGLGTPPDDIKTTGTSTTIPPQVTQWLEIYDYASDARFRGFVAANSYGQRSLFVFFEHNVVGKDLKKALMALIELATTPALPPCDQMVVCFDREEEDTPVTKALLRDLGWVGFELCTMKDWADGLELTSEKWLFVGMEV
jgi:hypothetical protein